EGLSEDEIIFRLRLASYTKTALIGSGNLVSRFFSYYRIPEIYNGMEDGALGEYSLAGMLRQRALDNPTAVYCMGINLLERERERRHFWRGVDVNGAGHDGLRTIQSCGTVYPSVGGAEGLEERGFEVS
ncbi:MAG: hypothetical protein K2I66_04705, partial [Bacteroidales bacterium]|nr:hypothetical protein [Bacteroidales bacterium]